MEQAGQESNRVVRAASGRQMAEQNRHQRGESGRGYFVHRHFQHPGKSCHARAPVGPARRRRQCPGEARSQPARETQNMSDFDIRNLIAAGIGLLIGLVLPWAIPFFFWISSWIEDRRYAKKEEAWN